MPNKAKAKAEEIDLDALQAEIDQRQAEAHRAAGARDAAIQNLKKLGCKTVEEAQKKLIELEAESERKREAFEAAYSDYVEKYQ